MARYDRIARIDPPDRDQAFSGWLIFRDLDGREREQDLARRARLRFLALRPVRRVLAEGPALNDDSLRQQLDSVQVELAKLPSGDPERERLDAFLQEVGGRLPDHLIRATLDVGRAAEAGGFAYAAEEYYRTGLELARAHDRRAQVVVSLRLLGRVFRDRKEWDEATSFTRESALLAASAGDLLEWARSMEGLAEVQLRRGERDAAGATLAEIEHRADSGSDGGTDIRALAAVGQCKLLLAESDPEAALEAGWIAVQRLEDGDEARMDVLRDMGSAFRQLGLYDAAAYCYGMVRRGAVWPEGRIEADIELATVAAEAGDGQTFAVHRDALLIELSSADRPLQASIWLGLSRGAALVQNPGAARSFLRDAIRVARDLGNEDLLTEAEALRGPAGIRAAQQPTGFAPTDRTLYIARELRSFEHAAPVPV